jgi:hypothetical protein
MGRAGSISSARRHFVPVDRVADGLRRPNKLLGTWPQPSSVRPVVNLEWKDSWTRKISGVPINRMNPLKTCGA